MSTTTDSEGRRIVAPGFTRNTAARRWDDDRNLIHHAAMRKADVVSLCGVASAVAPTFASDRTTCPDCRRIVGLPVEAK